VITEFSIGSTAGFGPEFIAAGSDGNLWFTELNDRIGRMTPLGVVTELSAGISAGARPFAENDSSEPVFEPPPFGGLRSSTRLQRG
jgi:streptogramin lyase